MTLAANSPASAHLKVKSRKGFTADYRVTDEGGNVVFTSRYATVRVSKAILQEVVVTLGVTYYQLAKMVNMPQVHHVYDWKNGKTRPGALYLNRMMKLLLLHGIGQLDVKEFDGATYWDNWTEGMKPKIRRVA